MPKVFVATVQNEEDSFRIMVHYEDRRRAVVTLLQLAGARHPKDITALQAEIRVLAQALQHAAGNAAAINWGAPPTG